MGIFAHNRSMNHCLQCKIHTATSLMSFKTPFVLFRWINMTYSWVLDIKMNFEYFSLSLNKFVNICLNSFLYYCQKYLASLLLGNRFLGLILKLVRHRFMHPYAIRWISQLFSNQLSWTLGTLLSQFKFTILMVYAFQVSTNLTRFQL